MLTFASLYTHSTCDLIGQLPLCLHGDGDSLMDQVQLGSLVSAHLVLLRADLLMPLLQMMVKDIDKFSFSWRLSFL